METAPSASPRCRTSRLVCIGASDRNHRAGSRLPRKGLKSSGLRLSRRNVVVGTAALVACRTTARTISTTSNVREVLRVLPAQTSVDGAGVKLHRALGQKAL